MPHLDHSVRLDFKDVLIRPKRSTIRSRADVDLSRHFHFKYAKKTLPEDVIPIISANMDTIGTFEMAIALSQHKLLTAIHKHYSVEEWLVFGKDHPDVLPYVIASCGMMEDDIIRLRQVLDGCPAVPAICLDVANGYSEHFVEFVKTVREKFPDHIIMVCHCRALIAHLQSIRGHFVAFLCSLMIVYFLLDWRSFVLGAGADFVMLGGMFAGHDQSGGELVERDGKKYKIFYGMSSTTAMKKHAGGVANYRSSEGKTVEVPYRGNVHDTVKDVLGGVRSTCTYVGAEKLKELPRRTTFIRVTMQLNNVFT
ncbi:PREDICTED: GMP reductase 1-like [Acropora digitifera]|uniref:GMP reductase 1-like n=1 Tax=Acropora digitifera TaxID=70779 RepID=UPI00077A5C79|nr:PREDICTED: GMP reductase 1-like [Acropora digitifera]